MSLSLAPRRPARGWRAYAVGDVLRCARRCTGSSSRSLGEYGFERVGDEDAFCPAVELIRCGALKALLHLLRECSELALKLSLKDAGSAFESPFRSTFPSHLFGDCHDP
jgi:hypothetical protein